MSGKKISIAQIRAQFPQYDALSDDDLLIGIRRKFYPNMPMGEFVKHVEYKAADPTEGMSGLDKFAAGYGKAGADLVRGAGQLVGAVSREDVAEARKRDAALMNTGAGATGNILGNLAALAPTVAAGGGIPTAAAVGAATGLLQPSTSTSETVGNVAIGGVAAPAAILLGRTLAAGYQGAKALVEPFTAAGQQRIASRVLQASATDPAAAAANLRNAKPLIPDSIPTVGQAAKDPGLAQLERTFLNNPEMAGPLQQRYAAQRAARSGVLNTVAGTDDYYNAIKDGRRIFANEDYANAITQGVDQDMAKAIQPQIQSLLERPSIQAAQRDAIRLAKENGVNLTDTSSLQGLDWVKKALDNAISKAGKPGSALGDEELRALVQTKDDLMRTLEQIAPGYKVANDNYAAMSRQVNSMDVARSLKDKLQKPGSEYAQGSAKEMGQAYQRALSESVDSVKKATGRVDLPLSRVMPTDDIAALEGVAYDLGRKQFAETAGAAKGSPTAQNLVSQNLLRRLIGPTGLPESWAENTMLNTIARPVQWVGKLGEPRIQNALAELMVDPQRAAAAIEMTRALPLSSRIGMATEPLLPQISLNALAAAAANRPQ
jgi:hypothetical protein